jgi:urease accessory protein
MAIVLVEQYLDFACELGDNFAVMDRGAVAANRARGAVMLSPATAASCRRALTLTTAAAEKVYRSQGLESEIGVNLRIDDGASLNWLPQETILFDRARVSRRIDIELAETASLLLAEIVVFGRTAMNEWVERGRFIDRWRMRRAGRLIFAETVRLDGSIGQMLSQPAIADGGCAIATVLIAPGDEALIARVREVSGSFGGEVGVSAWNGFALARFCAADAARLRADVIAVLKAVDADALPRLWLN